MFPTSKLNTNDDKENPNGKLQGGFKQKHKPKLKAKENG
jgi:hypothetical protein